MARTVGAAGRSMNPSLTHIQQSPHRFSTSCPSSAGSACPDWISSVSSLLEYSSYRPPSWRHQCHSRAARSLGGQSAPTLFATPPLLLPQESTDPAAMPPLDMFALHSTSSPAAASCAWGGAGGLMVRNLSAPQPCTQCINGSIVSGSWAESLKPSLHPRLIGTSPRLSNAQP